MDRICLFCEKEFRTKPSVVKRGAGKYCSYSCSSKARNKGKNNPRWKDGRTLKVGKCIDCRKTLSCYRVKKRCKKCAIKFFKTDIKWRKQLSERQKIRVKNGLHHWTTKENVKLGNKIRKLFEYKIWRDKVYKRDKYTCQNCKEKGGKLTAHHIKSFWRILDENKINNIEEAKLCTKLWNIKNGQTLCHPCHKLTNNWGGRDRKLSI